MAQHRTGLLTLIATAVCAAAPLAASATALTGNGSVVVQGHAPGEIATGAGTIIAETESDIRVLTAKHVVQFNNLTIRLSDGSLAPAHVISEIANRDLAIIEAPITAEQAPIAKPAELAAPRSNEPVSIMGGSQAGPSLENASIAKVGADLPDGAPNGRYALACGTCHQGDSGGGIFDANGTWSVSTSDTSRWTTTRASRSPRASPKPP